MSDLRVSGQNSSWALREIDVLSVGFIIAARTSGIASDFYTSWWEAAAPLRLCPENLGCLLATLSFICGTESGLYRKQSPRGRAGSSIVLARCRLLARSAFWLCLSWLSVPASTVWVFYLFFTVDAITDVPHPPPSEFWFCLANCYSLHYITHSSWLSALWIWREK